jgi:hypothetical protein
VQDLAKGRPTAHWLVLTNCELAFSDAACKISHSKYVPSSSGFITEAYVPIRSPGQALDAPCYAVLATTDTQILRALEALRQVTDDSGMKTWMQNHGKALEPRRDVSGLVKFGIESGSESGKLPGLQQNLAASYIVLADGKQPSWTTSLLFLLGGVSMAGGLVLFRRSGAEPTSDSL